ncbi:MAG: hypothetical protein A3A51_03700 [Candidatus Levybacteria bacterium RIFCSPLOWO2_01_FULL_39_10]|nr:MAG: hypothetical protein A3A51_03700 [Candidatus Levybacteria bacterium RIFCSPLOWO2_01_FULL_39_10]
MGNSPKKYLCPECGTEITKLPTVSYKEKGKVWHIPHFGKAKCSKCGWESEPYGKGLIQN